jgi:hypothetical protein
MGFYGRAPLLSLTDELIQTQGGGLVPAGAYRPIIVVEGEGGSGRSAFLDFIAYRWSDDIPAAKIMHSEAYPSEGDQHGGPAFTAVRLLLPQILLGLGSAAPGYRLTFRRVTLALVAMRAPVGASEPTEAKQEMLRRMSGRREARLSTVLTESLAIAAKLPPSSSPVDFKAVAERAAELLTERIERARFLARLDWGDALMWFAPDDRKNDDMALTGLVTLSRRAARPTTGNKHWVDRLLVGALLEDLRESVAPIPQRPGNCLLLLDNADSPVGQDFLTALAETRKEQAERGMAPDPLVVVACGSDLRAIGLAGEKPRRNVADLTSADFRRTAVWLRIGLEELSAMDVRNMVDERLSETDGLDSSVVAHMVYRLTGGHALSTDLVLAKLELDPSLIDDFNKLLASPGPEGSGSVEHYLLQKILQSLRPRRRDVPSLWRDLAILSAARHRDEAGYLTGLLTSDQADWRVLLADSLWSHETPTGRPALLPVARHLLLRQLARQEAAWDVVFDRLLGDDDTHDGAPDYPGEHVTSPASPDMAPNVLVPAEPSPAGELTTRAQEQLADQLHCRLALGQVAKVTAELAAQLDVGTKSGTLAAAAQWLELLDAAVTTPDLQAVRHQPAPEDRSWLQAGARVQPTASVLGLVTELQHVADPCSSNLQLLRERYLRICHHYGRLVDHLPAGAVLLLDRAQHYRKLALAIA